MKRFMLVIVIALVMPLFATEEATAQTGPCSECFWQWNLPWCMIGLEEGYDSCSTPHQQMCIVGSSCSVGKDPGEGLAASYGVLEEPSILLVGGEIEIVSGCANARRPNALFALLDGFMPERNLAAKQARHTTTPIVAERKRPPVYMVHSKTRS